MFYDKASSRGFLFVSFFIFTTMISTTFTQVKSSNKAPRFEAGPCAIEPPTTEKHVECGYLIVRENRRSKSKRTIRLPIAILKTESSNPKPDPVLKTLGGPGASSMRMLSARAFAPWLKDRDYIIFEQRGTRYAQPSLQCPEIPDAITASAKKQLDKATVRKNEIAAAKSCYDRLRNSGVDLNGFNSVESAADIEDLRRVLKLEKINLYGVSYSARLMLEAARRYPKGIRGLVLESTLPPDVNYDEAGVDIIVRAFNELFTSCRADSDCNAAYPNIEKEFYAVVKKLNDNPEVVKLKDQKTGETNEIRLNGDDFVTWIADYLFSDQPASTADAPHVIHEAFNGNFVPQFKRYAGDKLGGSYYSWGMRYSVWCSEEIPFEKMSLIKEQSNKYAGLKGYEVMALPDICSVWTVTPISRDANQPVFSNIPTLVLAAQYDAYTPPQWGRLTAKSMKNSYFFEVPWAGHGPAFSVPCVNNMIADFIADPETSPNSNCIETTRKQFKFFIKK